MGVREREADGREMTLAFALSAIERFEEPRRVFEDAREWSRYVGVVANDTDAVAGFVDEHGLEQDFRLGDRDKWLAMERIRAATDTDRHVYVGTTADDRRLADHLGWEFLDPGEVAAKAGWPLESGEVSPRSGDREGSPGADESLLDRLRDRLWPF